MRARGARVTDLAVIVVAADDGVKPQTEEAIDHARAAEVPIIVAVNKIDKEGAQPDRVRTEMTQHGLQPAEWGGEIEFVDVSAKTHQGLDSLLDTIQVVTDLEELKANSDAEASGTVIESKLDPGRGPVVTVLIQRGTLRVGDALVAGAHFGRVRAMHDFIGNASQARDSRRAGRGARLRRRARGRRDRARGRERAPRTPARRRARQPPEDRGAGAPLRAQGLAGGRLQARPGGHRQGAQPGRQGRRRRFARGDRGRDRQAAPARGRGQHHPPRRRRHQRVRRDARGGLRRRRSWRSTCAPSATRARSPSARAWRSAPTRSSTARSTSCARRCRACSSPPRSRRRSARPRCASCSAPRRSASIAGSYVTEGKVTRGAKRARRARRHGHLRHDDRQPAPLQRGRARGRRRLRVRHRARQLPGPATRATCSRPTRRACRSASWPPERRASARAARSAASRFENRSAAFGRRGWELG